MGLVFGTGMNCGDCGQNGPACTCGPSHHGTESERDELRAKVAELEATLALRTMVMKDINERLVATQTRAELAEAALAEREADEFAHGMVG